MLLQLVDKTAEDNKNRLVEIILTVDGRSKSFVTEYCISTFSENLKKDFALYFKSYLNQVFTAGDDKSVIDRLVSYGKYMGDRLVGDDLQLMSYREEIEDKGYSNLSVSIESWRIGFFEDIWEAFILPDSKYVLSSAVKSFVRRFGNFLSNSSDSLLEYDLSKEDPLRIFHANYLPEGESLPSAAYTSANEHLHYDGAVDYELWVVVDGGSSLTERLSFLTSTVHIFRYDGPLIYRQGAFYLPENPGRITSGESVSIPLLDLIYGLRAVKCGLLILNISGWLCDSSQHMSADTGLALAAYVALSGGIPNVLGLSNVTDPWTSNDCLSYVYKNIFKGLSLAQSVVEARKELQAKTESVFLSFSSLPFQSWPLLVHYELQPVVFFSSPQLSGDILHTQAYSVLRGKMHGFFSEFLPPHTNVSGDSVLLECLSACKSESGTVIYIHGGQGIGKTQLLHMLAFYKLRDGCEHAFYFDNTEYFYTAGDIKEMIAPIISAQNNEESRAGIADRYIFMLDNLGSVCQKASKTDNLDYVELEHYLNELAASQHVVVVTGEEPSVPFSGEYFGRATRITMRHLNQAEQRHMVSQLFKKHGIDAKDRYHEVDELLKCCRGNPFLIQHVMPKFSSASYRVLFAEVDRLFSDGTFPNCVEAFYSWQWRELSPILKRWLIMLANLRGVILEMLAVVCDSKSQFEPVARLNDIIGREDSTFSQDIVTLEKARFTVQYPAGRVINPRCISFINRQARAEEVVFNDQSTVSSLLSRIVCRSLATVVPRVIEKPDQSIIHSLVSNRGQWAKQLEVVWKDGFYEEFWAALSPLRDLLNQAGLSEDLVQWAFHLFSISSEMNLQTNLSSPGFLKVWLRLVSLGLHKEGAEENKAIMQTVEFCDQWINTADDSQSSGQAAMFAGIVQFLQLFYRKVREWSSLRNVCEIALRKYRQHEVWPLAVSTLNLLIECCFEQGDVGQMRAYEKQLLNDIPLDSFPAGFKWHLETKVITNCLARGELDVAQELLNQVYGVSANVGYQRQLLDMLQADIYFRQEKLEEAALLYWALLKSIDEGANSANKSFFSQRIAEIKDRLGAERFTQLARISSMDGQAFG